MLRSVGSLLGYGLAAEDGDIGKCRDFLFDDRDWAVRYMVADTGAWLTSRKVLISPLALQEPDWQSWHFPVALTRKQIEDSPPLDAHAPVSREYEIAYHEFFALPFYWTGAKLWGGYADPRGAVHPAPAEPQLPPDDIETDTGHLRSCNEVGGYTLQGADGDVGTLRDFIVDDVDWAIRFLVVDTRHWLPGGEVLVPTPFIERVDWTDRCVTCTLDLGQVRDSPPFDAAQPVDEGYRKRVLDHYQRTRTSGES